jgi:hypothetical protein
MASEYALTEKPKRKEQAMLKVRFFLNEPNGKPWKHFQAMMPRLGAKYSIEFDVFSQPNAQYQTDEYFERDLPVAPAVMVGEEVIVEGSDIAEDKLEAAICRQLGLPEPEPQKKGFLGRLFGKWLKKSAPENGAQVTSPVPGGA